MRAQPPATPDAARERLARKRADAKMGWFIHALVYVCVNAGLTLIAFRYDHGHPWQLYPLLGWGIGLAVHGVAVWLGGGGSGLYAQLLQRERQKLQ